MDSETADSHYNLGQSNAMDAYVLFFHNIPSGRYNFISLDLLQLSLFICAREVAPGYCKSMVLQHQIQIRKEETKTPTIFASLAFRRMNCHPNKR